MQEWLGELLRQYSSVAPLIVFVALVIAAFNIPISEDLTVIAAGIFVASVAPRAFLPMYFALIAGAVGGDMVSYALGRKVGRPLLKRRFFRRVIPEHKLERLSHHFARHAALTILLGRLIPFGVRNAISLFAGITHLNAWKFLFLDTLSGSLSISLIYFLSRHYGDKLLKDVRIIQVILLLLFVGIAGYIASRLWERSRKR